MRWLRAEGIEVLGPTPRDHRPLRHLAGPDHLRAQELAAALTQAPVDAIWCGRGGSGGQRTLQAIDAMRRWAAREADGGTPRIVDEPRSGVDAVLGAARPTMPLIGLSDATALLLWRAFRSPPAAAIHGPVITQLPRLDDASADALRTWLRAPDQLPTLRSDRPPLHGGVAEGEVVGGNLSLLASCAGTPEQPVATGRILLIEEVAEPAYRVDRMFAQLLRSGALLGVVGVAQGTFTDCPQPDAVAACLQDWAQRLGVPWVGPLPVGHGPECRPVGLGVRYRLSASRGTLSPLQTMSAALQQRQGEECA